MGSVCAEYHWKAICRCSGFDFSQYCRGFGRYHKKDKVKFYRYSFGFVKESFDWNEKSKVRNLLKPEEYEHIYQQLPFLPKEINGLIKLTNQKLSI